MLQVNVRGGFSDRNKIKPMNTEIQLKKFDARTRNKIANVIGELYNTYMGSCAEYEGKGQTTRLSLKPFLVHT